MLRAADSLPTPGASAAAPAAFPAWARAGQRAGKRRRSGLSGRRGACPPRRGRPGKPALGGRVAQTPGAQRRGGERRARRPLRGRGGLTRRVPSHPSGRRSRARGPAAPRLAGALRPLDRTLAFVFSPGRRGPGGSPRRGAAGGDRRRRGRRRGQAAGAVRRGASLRPRAARPDARRPAPVLGRPGRGGRAARGVARRLRAGAAPQMAVRSAVARRGAVRRRRGARRRRATAPRAQSCSPTPRRRRAPATSRPSSGGGRKSCWRPSRNCAPRGLRRRWRRCSTRIPSARPPKSAGKYRSAGRGGCSTGWLRSARSRELTGRATFRLYGL